MLRTYLDDLKYWKDSSHRKPLLVRGARQIGKTYCIQSFGRENFDNVVEINFELQKEYIGCFSTLYPDQIIKRIYALSQQEIIPGKTLLFFDEIQECPEAIKALRYFYEKMPQLHVIAAGSLLEFTLRKEEFRMPVGRVESLYMYPLSFKEYLMVNNETPLIEILETATLKNGVEPVFHDRLIELTKEYWILGGMPEVVSAYLHEKNLHKCQIIQSTILDGYRSDFGKYASQRDIRFLQRIYDKAPGLVGLNFKYVSIDPQWQSRDIKPALEDLVDAGILKLIKATSGAGLPLASTVNEKKFKLLFVDLGLVTHRSELSSDILMNKDLVLLNRGSTAEQFVGQELLAYSEHYKKTNLYYWERGKGSSTAEVDYLTHVDSTIVPIEVKAGTTGTLRSLQLFLNKRNLNLGVRISQRPLSLDHRVLSIPLYMIWELPRLVKLAMEWQ